MWANLNIGKKLGVGFGAVVLATMVLGVVSWHQLSKIGDSWSSFATTTLKQNDALMDAQVALRDGIHHFKNYVLRGGDYDQKFAADMAQLDKVIGVYRASGTLVADEDRALTTIADGARAYRENMAEAVKLRSAGQGTAEIDHAIKGADKPITEAMTQLQRLANEETVHESQEIKSIVESSALLIAVFCITIVVIAGGVAFVVTRSITTPLQTAVDVADRVAAGDLTRHGGAGNESDDEIGKLLTSLRKMRDELAQTIQSIVSDARRVTDSATQLSASAQQVAASTESQSQSTASAAAAVEQLTVSIDHVGTNADEASQRAIEAGKIAAAGGSEVNTATRHIGDVAVSVDNTAKDIQALSEQVQRIGSIATVIKEVADQTNLLALNAAIEAARAGEQGRGFAVVADEVRKLAERTTNSVQEITSMIGAIQVGADSAVTSMQKSRSVVTEVVSTAGTAAASMTGICSATDLVRESIGEISSALREQRSASTELSRSVETIAQMSEENSAAVGQVAQTASGLVSVSASLTSSVSRFRI
jgi:methyl-accepting chemotaxis protein